MNAKLKGSVYIVGIYTLILQAMAACVSQTHSQGINTPPDFEEIQYECSMGEKCYAYMFSPVAKLQAKWPVLVYLHGGPHMTAKKDDRPYIELFRENGFAVLALDYSGSRGHGAAYRNRTVGRLGTRDVDDVLAVANLISNIETLDKKRVALAGHSYGGYLALMVASRKQNYFRSVIALSAPTNFASVLDHLAKCGAEKCKAARQEMLEDLGKTTVQSRDRLLALSPVSKMRAISVPIFLIHGAQDFAIPLHDIVEYQKQGAKLNKQITLRVLPTRDHDLGVFDEHGREDLEVVVRESSNFVFSSW